MNGKQLKSQESTIQTSPIQAHYAGGRRYVFGKGIGLCCIAFLLMFSASDSSGRLVGSSDPLLDSHPGQFAAYFFAGFAGVCGLNLICKS